MNCAVYEQSLSALLVVENVLYAVGVLSETGIFMFCQNAIEITY